MARTLLLEKLKVSAPLRTLLLAGIVFSTQQLAAHRLNLATSDIVWQAQDSALEVTHTLHLDDALALLARMGDNTGTLDLQSSARLMNYLNKHFALVTASTTIALEPYGAHIDGGVLYMYQRATVKTLPQALEVSNTILHDVVIDAQNQVNWRVGEIVRSRTTSPEEPLTWLTLGQVKNNDNDNKHEREQ